ncbi:MAG: hypothetical protein ACXWBL_16340, partial [Usitatibacter sp.]
KRRRVFRRGRRRVLAILVVRHRQRVVFVVVVVVVSDDEGGVVEAPAFGVVSRFPAGFIVVVVLGEVVVEASPGVDEGAEATELPAGVAKLPEGEEVSVDAVVVEGDVVTVVVVLEPLAALAPELLYAVSGLLQPPRAAARTAAVTQGMRRFMIAPIGLQGSIDALHNACQRQCPLIRGLRGSDSRFLPEFQRTLRRAFLSLPVDRWPC